MYDILGKLASLEPKQEQQPAAKPIYESVEARGSIVAGVKDVEQKLREQFDAMKEGEVTKTKTGLKHKATDKYGAGEEPFNPHNPGKYARDLDHVNKQQVKDLDASMGITYKNRGTKGVEVDEERETLKTTKGTIYKGGTYGTHYDVGDDGTKKVKHVPKKGVKGRPKKEKAATVDAPKGDIFGRTTGKVPKGKKGVEVKGKSMSHPDNKRDDEELDEVARNPYAIGMAQAKKEVGLGRAKATGLPKKTVKRAHHIGDVIKSQTNESKRNFMRKLSEGVNFSEMMAERGRGIDELLAELQADIKSFKETGSVSDFLRDCMEVHGYGKKQLQDAVNPSRGPSFAPQHPATPAPQRGIVGRAFDKAKAMGQKALDVIAPGDDELLSQLERETGGKRPNMYNKDEGISEELNELARLAGLEVQEAKSPKAKRDYDDDGEVESEKEEVIGSRRKAAGLDESLDECMSPIGGAATEMQQSKGRMSVNTSADSEGHKTVTITADGEEAEKLAQLLALAGIGGHQQPEHAEAAIVVAQEAKEYGDTEVEEPEEVLNTPRPDVQGMRRSPTTGLNNDTDDLNKPKSQHPATAAKGDNPLSKKEKTIEDFNPLDSLGAKLMAEYQSIKIQK